MEKPVISVFHHKFGVSVAVVHGEDPAAYWARVDGYEGGDGEQWLESFDLAMPFAAAPEMLAALKECRSKLLPSPNAMHFQDGTAIGQAIRMVYRAIDKAEGRTA